MFRFPCFDFIARAEDEMDMIGHQAIRPDLHFRFAHVPGEHVATDVPIVILEE
jgi:hypothetical protein